MDERDWRRYIGDYHDSRPGITERLFQHADASPHAWLADSLNSPPGAVLDLACGSAPTRASLPDANWIGVDSSEGELRTAARLGRVPLVRADADALPLMTGAVGAVCASMCLPVLTPLPRVLAEIRRVLRPGGVLAALVPAQSGLSASGMFGWARVMYTLRALHQPWPNPGARDSLATLLRESGFLVHSDERQVFTLCLETPEAVALLVDGLYLPGLTPQRAAAAKRALAHWARPGRRLELPLRRVVAERSIDHITQEYA
ncbi:class I SAM-dependent methyltransferase [Streptomyces gobiensis]|uniref:class I SAM-dependent methyltransferase n=1 Tax=Streptomyces gobiensis TaxID=2875706 RepID=UPI001E416A6A|nr:class I SAM-dependent methyltransferase [Streptomyces gobiensis]UGY91225.1 class I SAM-dependent methyltransferase [Streptomyces gobiensis]